MCVIVDANAAKAVFGPDPLPAGTKFLDWIEQERIRMVVGGKLLEELDVVRNARIWIKNALLTGLLSQIPAEKIEINEKRIKAKGGYKSNDTHILALAQASGARLLYTNDRDLQKDFREKQFIDNPRGKIYTTLRTENFTRSHKKLLERRDLCQK